MAQIRTDLALEAKALWQERAGEMTRLEGVEATESVREGFPCTLVHITNDRGAQALGMPVGRYVTLTMDGLLRREENAFSRGVTAIARELESLMDDLPEDGPVLVVGLGNSAITPDAIGPRAHRYTLVTRHLVEGLPEQFGAFRPVSALAPGVLGTTGMESGQVVQAVCRELRPVCVVAVDALAARSVSRLCRTVQLADTGIAPGSGIGNCRAALNRETLGIPVLAVGVPTVVDCATLAADLAPGAALSHSGDLLVTPKDIDSRVDDLSKVIGYGISMALQPGLTVGDLDLLLT